MTFDDVIRAEGGLNGHVDSGKIDFFSFLSRQNDKFIKAVNAKKSPKIKQIKNSLN